MRAANQNTEQRSTSSGDLVQGTLEMLIMKTLALEPMPWVWDCIAN
jgi:hypothetical protein